MTTYAEKAKERRARLARIRELVEAKGDGDIAFLLECIDRLETYQDMEDEYCHHLLNDLIAGNCKEYQERYAKSEVTLQYVSERLPEWAEAFAKERPNDAEDGERWRYVREKLSSILAKATDGRFCRMVDHMTEDCDCRDIARFIGGELSDAAVDRARGAT